MGLVLGLAIAEGMNYSMTRTDVSHCLELQKQAAAYLPYNPETETGFFITQDEKDTCDFYGQTVNAEVL